MPFEAKIPYHPDTGCDQAKKARYFGPCLKCPFENCFMDDCKASRNEQILELKRNGLSISKIANVLNISKPTVKSVLVELELVI